MLERGQIDRGLLPEHLEWVAIEGDDDSIASAGLIAPAEEPVEEELVAQMYAIEHADRRNRRTKAIR